MSYSKDYKAAWAAARLQYQMTGSVQPHPPPEPITPPPPAPPPVEDPERAKGPSAPPPVEDPERAKVPPCMTKAGD